MSVVTREVLQSTKIKKAVRFSFDYDLKNLFLDVVNAKDRHLYEEFICKIRDLGQEIRDDELVQILREARSCISILDGNHCLFVQVILLLKWSHRCPEVVSEYQGFLMDLCSAHSYYVKNVVDHLVSCFKFDEYDFVEFKPLENHYLNVHKVIKTILKVIPMSKDLFVASIKDSFPYIKKSCQEHVSYHFNCLYLTTHSSQVTQEVLIVVVQNLITLDVSISSEDENQSKTLDYCMHLLMNYVKNECYDGDVLNFNKAKVIYNFIIKIFENCLISTHGTCNVQFIVFYLLSFKPVLCVSFLQMLWSKVVNPNVAPVIRQASVSYIASLLSRASYIPVSLVREMLSEMSSFLHSYIKTQESVSYVAIDTRIHGVFYSVCQGLFYVIAFRHKELTESKDGLVFLDGLNLSKIVRCRLNPLKPCDPVVAMNFANVARNYQLAYCNTIIERNSRSTLPLLSRDHAGNETVVQNKVESFFPFDPYTLPVSNAFVKDLYRDYDEVTDEPMQQDEDDDFLDQSQFSHSPHQSRSLAQQSRSPHQSILSQSPRQFLYSSHPGFLHIT